MYVAFASSTRNDLTYLTFLDLVTTTTIYCTAQIVNSRFAELNSFLSVQ
jgi:hypothetical protein